MLNSKKVIPFVERKTEEEQGGGKKLVQARLPFKILAGTSPSPKDCIENTNTKENVDEPGAINSFTDVIVLDDEEQKDLRDSLPETKIPSPKMNAPNKGTQNNTERGMVSKLQIKLPLSGKRKRSKNINHPLKYQGSELCDAVQPESQNMSKRVKLGNSPTKLPNNDCSNLILVADLGDRKQSSTTKRINTEAPNNAAKSNEDQGIMVANPSTRVRDIPVTSALKIGSDISSMPNINEVSEHTSNRLEKQPGIHKFSEEKYFTSNERISFDRKISQHNLKIHNTNNRGLNNDTTSPKQARTVENPINISSECEDDLEQIDKNTDQEDKQPSKFGKMMLKKCKDRKIRELQRKRERDERNNRKRREKEEKEEQRRRDKDAKDRKRLAEAKARNEERKKREEARESERRKKEFDRRRKEFEKEEEQNKKKKAAQAFTKYFVTKLPKMQGDEEQDLKNIDQSLDLLAFQPFQIKGDMKVAPIVRRQFNTYLLKELDSIIYGKQRSENQLYLNELKNGFHLPLKGFKTILKESDDDVVIVENELETAAESIEEVRPKAFKRFRAKFFLFHENRRPPYYGTWRKRSTSIGPRRPFVVDKEFFDYEIDSDDEWEEEEPGESLNGSEDEKDESDDDDYEVDNEWFVPHGHLSDEELQNEDEITSNTSREAQKAKLIVLQNEFAQEMKKKTEKIKPRLVGVIWEDEYGNRPSNCPNIIWDTMCARSMLISDSPLMKDKISKEIQILSSPPEKIKRIEINDELMSDLIRLVHGNRHSKAFLIKEYMEHVFRTCETIKSGECLAPTKTLIRDKIEEISEWSVVNTVNSKKKNKKKLCWIVATDVLDKYSLGKLGLHNEWSYKLRPKFLNDKNDPCSTNNTLPESKSNSEISKLSKYINIKTCPNKNKEVLSSSTDKPLHGFRCLNKAASRQNLGEHADCENPITG